MKKSIEELIELSKQKPKYIYRKNNTVINNGTAFTIKKPFGLIIKPMIFFANCITKCKAK